MMRNNSFMSAKEFVTPEIIDKINAEIGIYSNKIANSEFIKRKKHIIEIIESILLENGINPYPSIESRLDNVASKKGRPTKRKILYVSVKNDVTE